METRSSNKRKWKSSPDKKKARTSLDFGHLENTPPRKKFRFNSKDRTDSSDCSSDIEPRIKPKDSFGIKSFYGGREKKHFPHSPGRRKAVGKVLSKLSDENQSSESDEDAVALKKSVQNNEVPEKEKDAATCKLMKKGPALRQSARKQSVGTKQGRPSVKPLSDVSQLESPRQAVTADSIVLSTPKQNVDQCGPETPVQKSDSSSVKKFFKHKSPLSADKAVGSVIVRQGFNLKFIPKKSLSSLKQQTKTNSKKNDSRKRKRELNYHKVSGKIQKGKPDISMSCDNKKANSLVQNDSDSAFHSVPSGEGSFSSTDVRNNTSQEIKDKESPSERVTIRNNTSQEITDRESPSKRVTRTNFPQGSPSVTLSDSCNALTEISESLNIYNSPSKITRQTIDKKSAINSTACPENYAGSADLFSSTSGSSSLDPPSIQSSPGSETSTNTNVSSLRSGPTLRSSPGKKFFPIFSTKAGVITPKHQTRLQKLSRKQNSPRTSPRLKFIESKDDQMMLDAGQKKYGATQCEVCGMVYSHAEPADETTHAKFHHSLMNVLKFPGWKKERVVQEFPEDGSRIVVVLHGDQKCAVRKVEELNKIMGQELGYSEAVLIFRPGVKAFLIISEDKKIMGCCIAESVSKGYRVIPDSQPSQESQQRPWCCQSEPEPASVGISRIWVQNQHRRKGVASKLLDSVRQWFEYGVMIKKSRMAFSDPTPDGKQLAIKYFGSTSFLVYKYG